jgi:hypothetical protein
MGILDWLFRRKPIYRWEMLPTVTPDMIEPQGVPLSRSDAAKGYVNFYLRYLGCEEYAEEERNKFLDFVSSHIAYLEYEREETQQRLKKAKLALHILNGDLDRADSDECVWANTYDNEPIEETIARRQARFDRLNTEIGLYKADCRLLLTKFINQQVDELKAMAGTKQNRG